MFFTSLPILIFGLLEQNHSMEKLIRYPYLYKLNKDNYLMSKQQFLTWALLGIHRYMYLLKV